MFQTNCAYLELNCRCQYCNYQLDNIILKGGPIQKPYWLPWAPWPHLFLKFYMYTLCVWQNDNKNNKTNQ